MYTSSDDSAEPSDTITGPSTLPQCRDVDKLSMEEIIKKFQWEQNFTVSKDSVQGVYKKYKKDDRYTGPGYLFESPR